MEKIVKFAFPCAFVMAVAIFVFGGIMAFYESDQLGRCMARGYTGVEVTMSGSYCRKWTTMEGEIVVPLK